jgi:hypothetical protein
MRLLLKILAAAIVGVLTLLVSIVALLLDISKYVLNFISCLFAIAGFILFTFIKARYSGAAFIAFALIISPIGLPGFAKWLIGRISNVNRTLREFITS